ncbi:MAG: glutathione S-transferase family protein [Alphaproteobacteria bacterium]|nr:glutathione S-transferase family protein [Alphaproteobacteria bacterium]
MILIGRDLSPFTRRVAISLDVLGFTYERKQLSTATDALEIRQYNPLGRVPALVLDTGESLIDSSAILDYLDETVGPDRSLIPASGPERRHILRLVSLALGVMEKSVAAYYERTRRPAETRHPPWLNMLEDQTLAGLEALNSQADSKGPWLALGRMTQADISAVAALDFADTALPNLLKDVNLPRLRRLALHLQNEPAFLSTKPKA